MTRHLSKTPSKVALIATTLAAMTLWFTPSVRADKYGELTAAWWQWLFKQPVSTNPWFDETGERAANGQENGSGPAGKYFFLAGAVTNPGIANRTITVPAGKALSFGVINTEWDTGGTAGAGLKVPDLRARAAADIATVTDIYASLCGRPLEIRRIQSPIFSYSVPAIDSVLGPDVIGTVKQAYTDGYWVYVAPLPPGGPYTLNFGGAAFGSYTEDITFHITVK